MVEFYSNDCFAMLTNILQKVGELMLHPWQHGIAINSQKVGLMFAIICPALVMVKEMLCSLIAARGVEVSNQAFGIFLLIE